MREVGEDENFFVVYPHVVADPSCGLKFPPGPGYQYRLAVAEIHAKWLAKREDAKAAPVPAQWAGWKPVVDPYAYDPANLPEIAEGERTGYRERPNGYYVDPDGYILNRKGHYQKGVPPEEEEDVDEWRLRWKPPELREA
jgi:hypothetical protein